MLVIVCTITAHVCDVGRPTLTRAELKLPPWSPFTPLISRWPSLTHILLNTHSGAHSERSSGIKFHWLTEVVCNATKFAQNISKMTQKKKKKNKSILFDRMNSDTHVNRCYWWVTAAMLSLKSMEMEVIGCMLNISLKVLVCEVKEFKNGNSSWHVICQSLQPLVDSSRIKTTWNQLLYIEFSVSFISCFLVFSPSSSLSFSFITFRGWQGSYIEVLE